MNRPLALAALIAVLVFVASRRPFLTVAVFALVYWWLNAQERGRTPTVRVEPSSVEAPDEESDGAPGDTADDGIDVRCEVATDVLQRWVSDATGRGYEVPPDHGVPGARPGMRGRVVVHGGRVHVRPAPETDVDGTDDALPN